MSVQLTPVEKTQRKRFTAAPRSWSLENLEPETPNLTGLFCFGNEKDNQPEGVDSMTDSKPFDWAQLQELDSPISTEDLKRVVRLVVGDLKKSKADEKRFLKTVIREDIPIRGGYRDKLDAPIGLLEKPLCKLAANNRIFRDELMIAWQDCLEDFGECVEDFLKSLDESLLKSAFESADLLTEGISQLVREFLTFHEEFEPDDVRLMIFLKIRQLSREAENEYCEEEDEDEIGDHDTAERSMPSNAGALRQEISSELFLRWLHELADLDSNAKDWEDLPAFLRLSGRIGQEKAEARTFKSKLGELEDCLRELRDDLSDEVEYLEILKDIQPTPVDLPESQLESTLDLSRKLAQLVRQHAAIRMEPCTNRTAELDKREQVDELAERARGISRRLSQILGDRKSQSQAEGHGGTSKLSIAREFSDGHEPTDTGFEEGGPPSVEEQAVLHSDESGTGDSRLIDETASRHEDKPAYPSPSVLETVLPAAGNSQSPSIIHGQH